MIVHDIEQRTPEWFALRAGKITGTSFRTMANGTKAGIESLCQRVAIELIEGPEPEEGYKSAAMENGIAMEGEARRAYELETWNEVREVGFVEVGPLIGFSPDGLIGDDGGVEIKNPLRKTHEYYCRVGKYDTKYDWQMQGSMWASGKNWWDFVSYCEAFTTQPLLIIPIKPDPEAYKKLDAGHERCKARVLEILGYWAKRDNVKPQRRDEIREIMERVNG